MKIYEPFFLRDSYDKISKTIESGNLGFGPNVVEFEKKFKNFSGKKNNIATNSASAAAFMIFYYLYEQYGPCEVYTTTLGFISPAWAAKHVGHTVHYVDITKELQFDCKDYRIKRRNTNSVNPKVVMPVLYGGVDNIKGWNLVGDEIVVVDSAHCVTPSLECDFSFFSFHPMKPICTSDGGMISTDHDSASEYFRSFRNFGRKNVGNTYDIAMNGFKFYMNNLNATFALESMRVYDTLREKRKKNYEYISEMVDKPLVQHSPNSSYYIGSALRENSEDIMKKLNTSRLYPLLHKTTAMKQRTILINAEKVHPKIVNFPIHHNLTKEQIEYIISVL